jgi:CRP-like cAMP-binding protein
MDSPIGMVLRFSLDEAARRAGERHAIEGTALRRLARFLLQTNERRDGAEPIDIPLGVLASVLGMRPETLSRALSDLRTAGALAPGRSVRVVNREKLRTAAE